MPDIREFVENDILRAIASRRAYDCSTSADANDEEFMGLRFPHSNYRRSEEAGKFELYGEISPARSKIANKTGWRFMPLAESCPIIEKDFDDPSDLLSKFKVKPTDKIVFYQMVCEGLDFNAVRYDAIFAFFRKIETPKVKDGVLVAKLSDNCYYVHHNIMHPDWVGLLESSFNPPDDSAIKQRWLAHLGMSISTQLNTANKRLNQLRKDLAVASLQAGNVQLLNSMIQSHGVKHLDSMLIQIRNLASVESLAFTGNCGLLITTKQMHSEDTIYNGEEWKGRYTGQWEINLELNSGLLKARNIRAVSEIFQHAHSGTGDKACLGGFHYQLCICFQQLNYLGLISNTIEYLRDYDVADGGARKYIKMLEQKPKSYYKHTNWINMLDLMDANNLANGPVDRRDYDGDDDEEEEGER